MKNNVISHSFRWLYLAGFCVILALPILTLPPYFFPPDWGKTILFRSVLALLSLIFAYQFFYERPSLNLPNIKKNPIVWALIALFSLYFLSTIFSVDAYFSLWANPIRSGGVITFAFYFIFALFCFAVFKKSDWVRAWDVSIFIGILVSLITLIQYYGLFSNIFLPVADRPSSTMGNPILLAIYLLFLLFTALVFAIGEKRLHKKAYYLAAFILFLYAILISGSRAAYLGIFIAIAYFFVWYPVKSIQNPTTVKIVKLVKMATVSLLILVLGAVFYINTAGQYPQFLEQNRVFNSVAGRLSVSNLLEDTRLSALRIEFKMLKAKPLTGYGMENFSVGFDKYYVPTPELGGIVAWWDRAHNILLQTVSDAGIFGLVAYLGLFIALFWQLGKAKKEGQATLLPHGIQATLIGYFVANLFSFDSFASYLLFFLVIGYSLHITSEAGNSPLIPPGEFLISRNIKKIVVCILFFIVAIFLWQYNAWPFYLNAKINKAEILADQKQCDQAFVVMDTVLTQHSFLDSYARLKYAELIKTCADFYPQNISAYKKRGIEVISQAVKIQPNYTRYWIFLGTTTNDMAAEEQDTTAKTKLIGQAQDYLAEALILAPRHQEIITQQARTAIIAGDYAKAQEYAQHCIAVNPDFGECYFYLALAQIYVKNTAEAQKNLQIASQSFGISSKASLEQLSNAYGFIKDWPDLVSVYQALIELSPNVAQYHSSLAFFYSKTGQYQEARQEALEVLRLSPESKPSVDAFLKTLPK